MIGLRHVWLLGLLVWGAAQALKGLAGRLVEPPALLASAVPCRIIATAPTITETLWALGVGERVVGVSQFCDVPPEAQRRAKVGGLLDPNLETIIGLRPDLVIIFPELAKAGDPFTRLGIKQLVVRHDTIAEIIASLRQIGLACGAAAAGDHLAQAMERAIADIQKRTAGCDKLKAAVCLTGGSTRGPITHVILAGRGNYFDEALQLARAENVYARRQPPYPKISAEGLYHLDPDVIIDLLLNFAAPEAATTERLQDWQTLADLRAVRQGRVYVLAGDHLSRPGPRLAQLLRDFARALHPDREWSP